ncbi:hypothetical protein CCB80_07995 [Armatimonadetes bacterium Uphvl-Ar1]|nr:hypothetical protein CCB80_07995 [Armatimonadetes bacterium Uphvl-Ar1]
MNPNLILLPAIALVLSACTPTEKSPQFGGILVPNIAVSLDGKPAEARIYRGHDDIIILFRDTENVARPIYTIDDNANPSSCPVNSFRIDGETININRKLCEPIEKSQPKLAEGKFTFQTEMGRIISVESSGLLASEFNSRIQSRRHQ